jgi:hypothetical protein
MQIIYYENISHVESKSTSFVLLKLIKFIQITSLFLLEIGQLLCSSSSCLQTLFSSASIGVIEIKKKQEHTGTTDGTRNGNYQCCTSGDVFLFFLQSPCTVLLAVVDTTRREGKWCARNREQRAGGRALASGQS